MEKISNSDVSMEDPKTKQLQEVEVSEGTTVSTGPTTPPEYAEPPQFDAKRTKTLLRKLDWHLVPFLSLLYL
jgi:hypothetical protein